MDSGWSHICICETPTPIKGHEDCCGVCLGAILAQSINKEE